MSAPGYPQISRDPTSVVGSRVAAYLLELLLFMVIMAFVGPTPLSPLAEYVEVPSGVDSAQACERLGEIEDVGSCIQLNDRVYFTDPADVAIQGIVSLLWFVLVYVLWQGTKGLTPGKAVLGLRVVDENGQSPGPAKAFVRSVLWIVDFWLIGLILAITSTGHRRLGDTAAKTYVVGKADVGRPIVVPGMTPAAGAYGVQPGYGQGGYGQPAGSGGWGAQPGAAPGGAWGAATPSGQSYPQAAPTAPPAAPPTAPGGPHSYGAPVVPAQPAPPAAPGAPTTGEYAAVPTSPTAPAAPATPAAPPASAFDQSSDPSDSDSPASSDVSDEPAKADEPSSGEAPAVAPSASGDTGSTGTSAEADDTPEPAATEPAPPPTAAAPAPTTEAQPPAAAPPAAAAADAEQTYNPQWDAARGAYIQWDPNRSRWLQWDDTAKEWKPI